MRLGRRRRLLRLLLLVGASLLVFAGQGLAAAAEPSGEPGPPVEAAFGRESYLPGQNATLVLRGPAATVQVFRLGTARIAGLPRDALRGSPVTEPAPLALVQTGKRAWQGSIPIGDWPSGLYYAELRGAGGKLGYALFVVLPERLGTQPVAVVMPTNTWAAYNRRDMDGDGAGDTWYEDWSVRTIDLSRPFLDRGVPPRFRQYDAPFLRWLSLHGKEVEILTQRELEQGLDGAELARRYDLIVFPGHHEYVTEREYDVIEEYRDAGGDLAFLSANNFFWRVVKRGQRMTRTAMWRNVGRPEAALVGVQYLANDRGTRSGPYRVLESAARDWLFAETALEVGSEFGRFGIEIDHVTAASPGGIEIVAEARDVLGRGKTAQMTYYETRTGARVFAAGAFTLAGSALSVHGSRILENLWGRLAPGRDPPEEPAAGGADPAGPSPIPSR